MPLALACAFALVCAQASAATFELGSPTVRPAAIIEPPASFGEPGSGPGQFGGESPFGVAVETSTGDVFALDQANRRVEKFGPAGKYLSELNGGTTPAEQFAPEARGLAVDNSITSPTRGDVYVADTGHNAVDRFRPKAGEPNEYEYAGLLVGLSSPEGVAVDSKGDVYVVQPNSPVVFEFGPKGEGLLAEIASAALTRPVGVAVASNGDLYVVNFFNNLVKLVRGPKGEVESSVIDTHAPTAVAVDPSGNVYVADTEGGSHVTKYDASGELVEELGAGNIDLSLGLAYSAFNEDLYVGDIEQRDVHVFEEEEAAGKAKPRVRECTGAASTHVNAVVSCFVAPHAAEASVYVEYGEVGSSTLIRTAAQTVTASGVVKVELAGLKTHTEYAFTLVASNEVGSARGEEAAFATPAAVKGVSGCAASGVDNEGAALHGSLEPEGVSTSWYFEYGPGTEYGSRTAEESSAGNAKVTFEPGVTKLKPHTAYHCRLVAYNVYGTETGEAGEFETTGPPTIDGESFSGVGTTLAKLSAQVNDEDAAATYRFEYGGTSGYGFSTPEAKLAAVGGDLQAAAQAVGLQPGVEYHFRVVVTDTHGTTAGADATFTTFPASGAELPDGRVYEMVSPLEAQGANVYVPEAHNGPFPVPTMLPFEAAANGEAVAYAAAPSAGGNGDAGAGGGNEFIARSTPAGWVAQDVMPPGGGGSPVFLGFSSDLSAGIVESREPLSAGAPGGGFDVLYSRTSGDGSYHPLFSEAPSHRSAEEFASFGTVGPRGAGLAYAGASADSGDLLFEANDALAEAKEDPGREANDLYESAGGQLSLVNVLPGGEQAPDATFGAPNETGRPVDSPDFSDVISADGTRVFWTDLHAGADEGHVYVRENGASTVPVSAGAARYWTATPDGRYAFYTEGEKLYRFDVESAQREELAGAGAGVLGVVGASEDGSYLYFVATGKLAEGATEGQPNLYLLREGSTVFIATLAVEDEGSEAYGEGSFGDWEPGLGHRTAQVTPNGHSIVFESVRPLTGYDSEGLGEVFVYDAEPGGGLFCASCDPSGEAPPVTEVGGVRVKAASYLPVSWSRTYMPRLISEDGSRVFFDSFEPLVAPDSNAQQDVYEWERDGAGSCQEARGCEYLLSGATSRAGSYLVDASANGDDVFFVSDARLVPRDEDESDHLYDVRVGGVQPSAPAGCSGAACQQVPIAPLIFATPPSATFAGVGNFPPPAPAKVKPKPKPKHKHKHKHKQPKHKAKHGKQSSARKTGKRARRAGRGKAGRS